MLKDDGRILDNKIKAEKVELVKQLIRKNNYRQYEKTHQQCNSLGITVNRDALDRFAEKLELIDKAQQARSQRHYQHPSQDLPISAPLYPTTKRTEASFQQQVPKSTQSTYRPGASVIAVEDMTYEQVKKRETEITFELGALKIKESELLQELNSLSSRLKKSERQ